jgi:hypothetical protein
VQLVNSFNTLLSKINKGRNKESKTESMGERKKMKGTKERRKQEDRITKNNREEREREEPG